LTYRAVTFVHLIGIWYIGVVVGIRAIVVNKPTILESFMRVIAVEDEMPLVDNRYGMKEIIHLKVDHLNVYRQLVSKRVVSHLIRVVVRISVQLMQE